MGICISSADSRRAFWLLAAPFIIGVILFGVFGLWFFPPWTFKAEEQTALELSMLEYRGFFWSVYGVAVAVMAVVVWLAHWLSGKRSES